jgi:molybdenum cofactor cytidylyltransferase
MAAGPDRGGAEIERIAAVIPAAGYSSRLGFFKPLLPAGSSLVMEKSVQTFRQAGIEDIRVVVGHKADLLVPVLDRSGVKTIMNPDYDRGMYTSVQAGVRSLEGEIEAFFLLPADYAFVSAETIRGLLRGCEGGSFDVVYPVYHGERGHPPLISARLRDPILAIEPDGGLKGLLEREARSSAEIDVDDEGILIDLDSEEDYQRSIRGRLPPYPGRQECLRILQEHRLPGPIVEHVQVVAGISGRIAECLNSRGYRLHLGIVVAASLLHDIARGERDHARKGSQLVARLGYPEVADVIASHMILDPDQRNQIDETAVVYLADKLVSGNRVVSLDERLGDRLNRFSEGAARQAARERMEQAAAIQQKIEDILGLTLGSILGWADSRAADGGGRYDGDGRPRSS